MKATREILEPLGFHLRDCGDYWQSNAPFRNGDNPTSLQIYKKTGVWIDWAKGEKPKSFNALMRLAGGQIVHQEFKVEEEPEERIKIHKTYDPAMLTRLLPHYSFYNSRGILDETLKLYRCGLATSGKMYQRFVFPVFNEHGKICGFSGRDMLNKETRPKWKHIGPKKEFIYPFFMRDENGRKTMDDSTVDFSQEVFLIESIGDSLSMSQNGMKNHFVTFGLKPSTNLIARLISLNPKSIHIAYNNDSDEKFAGLCGALKTARILSEVFSKNKIHLSLPNKNDFGDMGPEDYAKYRQSLKKTNGWNDIVEISKESLKLKIVTPKCVEGII